MPVRAGGAPDVAGAPINDGLRRNALQWRDDADEEIPRTCRSKCSPAREGGAAWGAKCSVREGGQVGGLRCGAVAWRAKFPEEGAAAWEVERSAREEGAS